MKKRNQYTAELKTKVVLEVLHEEETVQAAKSKAHGFRNSANFISYACLWAGKLNLRLQSF
jgi:hypothetical protein